MIGYRCDGVKWTWNATAQLWGFWCIVEWAGGGLVVMWWDE